MEYEELLHRCFRCGWCKLPTDFTDINCPSYMKYRFETYSPGGRLWLIRAWLNGEIEMTDRFKEIMFSCATCRNCVEACGIPKIKDYIVDIMIAAKGEIINTGKLPLPIRNYLMEIHERGNPFKKPQSERGDWAKELDIPLFKDQEYLFYVGDVGSFDEMGVKMTRDVASLLVKAGISIGILGKDEYSDGNDVRALGEKELFKYIAEKNISQFNELGIKKIITLSPHGYNAIKNDYPQYGGNYQVFHYTQIINRALDDISPGKFSAKVTYHDSCYLGRWNSEYSASRNILSSIPGLTLVEMNRNMGNSLCCGGGGGNFFTDILGSGKDSPGRTRVREAVETGAEVIAASCPICCKMLDDAVKDEGKENSVRVMDVARIINESIKK